VVSEAREEAVAEQRTGTVGADVGSDVVRVVLADVVVDVDAGVGVVAEGNDDRGVERPDQVGNRELAVARFPIVADGCNTHCGVRIRWQQHAQERRDSGCTRPEAGL
jgi:hypothetical protein